jgi:hypothetical protein
MYALRGEMRAVSPYALQLQVQERLEQLPDLVWGLSKHLQAPSTVAERAGVSRE